jgi:hypothetical protein
MMILLHAREALKCTKVICKCYTIFIIIGSFLLFTLGGCQSINPSDLENNVIGLPTDSETILHSISGVTTQIPKDWTYGAVLSKGNLNLLKEIKNTHEYEAIVIMAPTSYKTEENKIFTYSSSGDLAFRDNIFSQKSILQLSEANLVKDLGSVPQNSYWKEFDLQKIINNFPAAKLIIISVNEDIEPWESQVLAYGLKSHLPRKSLIISINEDKRQTSANPLIDAFQQEYIIEAIGALGEQRIASLPFSGGPNLNVLYNFLVYHNATKASVTDGYHALYQSLGSGNKALGNVYMVAFGDIMLGRHVQTLMSRHGRDYPFTLMEEDYLKVNDVLVANLEGPIAKNAIQTSKTIAFRFMPDVAPLLKKYHFDILSLANNHTIDMGAKGYTDSVELLNDQSIIPFGDPRQITPESIAKTIVNGHKLAFLGLEEVVYRIDDQKAIQTVKELTAEGYKVIVSPHWGVEYVHKPNKRQKDLAHSLIDAGAFAVIGHHPHVVQAYETYKNRPIFYSLGNAIFDQYWSVQTQIGLSAAIKFNDSSLEINFIPLKIDYSRPRLMNQSERDQFFKDFITYGDFSEEEKQALLSGKITIQL